MNRFTSTFAALKAKKQKALIPYISAGDPDPAQTVAVLHALVAGGANILELGIPFSDPAADGKTIAAANERALARGVTFLSTLDMVRAFRRDDTATPLVIMGYLNSFERRGFGRAMAEAQDAGVDAVILVDCPVEALPDYEQDLHGVAPILLVAPTTNPARRAQIAAKAQGFLYFVSLKGITGTQRADATAIGDEVRALRALSPVPVCVGFGIRDGQTARAMAQFADGVVIGSALVAKLHAAAAEGADLPATGRAFVADIRHHLDALDAANA